MGKNIHDNFSNGQDYPNEDSNSYADSNTYDGSKNGNNKVGTKGKEYKRLKKLSHFNKDDSTTPIPVL